jgi:hypothetical protein
LLIEYPTRTALRTSLRDQRIVALVSGIVVSTTMNAYAVTSRPTRDSVTPKAALMAGSRPKGRSSVVTATHTEALNVSRPANGQSLASFDRPLGIPTTVDPTDDGSEPPRRFRRFRAFITLRAGHENC